MTNTIIYGTTTLDDSRLYGGVDYKFDLCEDDLSIGNTPSAEITFTTDYSGLSVDDMITYKHNNQQVGIFYVKDITKSKDKYKIVAYDSMSLFDVEIADFLDTITQDYLQVYDWFGRVCGNLIKISYSTTELLNRYVKIPKKIIPTNLTARQFIGYLAEIGGCNVIATETGTIRMQRVNYNTSATTITNSDYSVYNKKDYITSNIDCVKAQQTDGDIGIFYPTTGGSNALIINCNPLLVTSDYLTEDDIRTALQNIYDNYSNITYTPCDFSTIFNTNNITVGKWVSINGNNSYITSYNISSSGYDFVSCGNKTRSKEVDSGNSEIRALSGKYNILNRDLNETKSEVGDLSVGVSTLTQTVSGFDTRITTADGKATEAKQTADGFSTRIENAEGDINTIEQTLEGVAFTSSLADGTTTINGGCITTGTIDASKATISNLSVGNANITSLDVGKLRVNGSAISSDNRVTNSYTTNGYVTTQYVNSTIHMTDVEGGASDTVIGPNGVKVNGTTYSWTDIGAGGGGGTAKFG